MDKNRTSTPRGSRTVKRDIDDKTISYRIPDDYRESTRPAPPRPRVPDRGYPRTTERRGRPEDETYTRRPPKPSDKAPRKNNKTRYAPLFAVVIFSAVVICISAFALLINTLSPMESTASPAPTERASGVLPAIDTKKEVKLVCLIQTINTETRTFTLYGIDNGRIFYASAATGTEMKNSYGQNLVFGEFKPGDVVEVMYYEGDAALISIKQSAQSQLYANQSDLIVTPDKTDPTKGTITRGNTTYIYGPELICTYDGQPFDPGKISAVDKVNLRVYRTVAVSMEVTAGHGVIEVVWNDYIRDASIEIDTDHYARLEGDKSYDVTEGLHKIVVKGANIENYIKEVTVTYGGTATVNLSEVQYRYGVLYFASNIDINDLYVTINDTHVDAAASYPLPYGAYEIKATSYGYENFSQIFNLSSPMHTFNVNMRPLPTPTPKPVVPDTTRVVITTNVGGAEVYLDNQYVGLTTDPAISSLKPLSFDVEVGNHELRIYKEGYEEILVAPFVVTNEYTEMSRGYTLQEINNIMR